MGQEGDRDHVSEAADSLSSEKEKNKRSKIKEVWVSVGGWVLLANAQTKCYWGLWLLVLRGGVVWQQRRLYRHVGPPEWDIIV